MKRISGFCLLFSVTLAQAQSLPAGAPPASQIPQERSSVATLAREATAAYEVQNYAKYTALLQDIRARQPYNSEVMAKLAGAYALTDQPEKAFGVLVQMQQQGLAFDLAGAEDFDNINQYQLFKYLAEHLSKNAKPFDRAELAFTVAQQGLLPESIDYHERADVFYIGSVRQGGVWRVTPSGEAEVFIAPGSEQLQSVTAVAVDEKRDALWVASSPVPQFNGQETNGNAALYRFSLEDGALEARFPLTEKKLPHLLSNIVIAPAGRVFVSDAVSPLIFSLSEDSKSLQPFIGSPAMTSLQGLALSPDGKYLFVTDFTQGLFRIELDNREVVRIGHGPEINLGGIHDIAWYNDSLIAIQPGTRPARVVRYLLSENRAQVTGQQPLSANEAEYDQLGQGVVVGDSLYFIANSQWSLLNDDPQPASDPQVVKVLKADLTLGEEIREKTEMTSAGPAGEDADKDSNDDQMQDRPRS